MTDQAARNVSPANMPGRRKPETGPTPQAPQPSPTQAGQAELADVPESASPATVEWWDIEKGFGLVKLGTTGETAIAHSSVLPGSGYRCLVAGEELSVLTKTSQAGKLQVTQVFYSADQIMGTVSEFDHLKGHGSITRNSDGASAFVHYSDILHATGTRTTLTTGEQVTFKAESNDRGLAAKQVKRLDPRAPLQRFARFNQANWQSLADLAEKDVWILGNPDEEDELSSDDAANPSPIISPVDLPLLRSYIQHTFSRIEEQGRISYGSSDDGNRAAFNTGLVTPNQEEIYGVFAEKPDHDGYPWRLLAWMKASDGRIAGVFTPRPARATYWDDPSVLYYDARLPLFLDWDHFIEDNISRYPEDLQDKSIALMLTRSAVDRAIERVERNYKAAVPQFHRGEIQLLLPLALRGTAEVQLALVVRQVGEEYHGETVLPLSAALKNARLLARPDRDWLNP